MNTPNPAGKPTLLLVDDEERVLRSLRLLFRAEFNVLTTIDGREAVRMAREQRVHVVISDQRMPLMPGVEVLRQIRMVSPNTMRLLLTGYADLAAVVGSVNEGEIFRFLQKPWDADQIRAAVREAADVAQASFDQAEGEQMPALTTFDPARPVALLLDSDPQSHALVRQSLPEGVSLYWAQTLDEALSLLEEHPVGVMICEALDKGRNHIGAIKALKQTHPALVTILLTHTRDYEMLVGLINQGQVFRFHPKPGHQGTLRKNVASALERHELLNTLPVVRQRHQVEKSTKPLLSGFSDKVMGYFRRLGVS